MDLKKRTNGDRWQLCCSALLGLTFWLGLAEWHALADQPVGIEANKVIVAVPRNYPPHYRQTSNGQMQGFAIDVIEKIASRAGLQPSYLVKDNWPSAIQALRDGEADLIPNLDISQAHESEFLFTEPLETFAISIFIRQSATGNSATADLGGKKVGSVEGNVAVKMLRRREDLHLQIYATPKEALFALLSREIDALVYPQPWIWTAAVDAGIESLITPVGEPLLEVQRALAVSKHRPDLFPQLAEAVHGFRDSAEYRRAYSHWFRPAPPFWTIKRTAILMGLTLGLVICLLLSWRLRSLRRTNLVLQQSSKTREQALLRLEESQAWNREAENALRRSQKMEAVGQIVGGIAHDFNNLLSIILGNLDILTKQSKQDDKASRRLQRAALAARRGADLIRQLQACARHEPIDKQQTLINQLIREMDSLIMGSVTPAITVEVHLDTDLWPVCIEPGDLQDSLLYLIINARDAMMEGGRLMIETHNVHLDAEYVSMNHGVEPGDYVQLVINDTGTGIDPAIRERVFEPFFTTKPQANGSGLGLSMVYGFVKRSGGLVKVYSEPDSGSKFHIYLPRMVAAGAIEKKTMMSEKSSC